MTKDEYRDKVIRSINKPKSQQTAKATKYPQQHFNEKECKLCKKLFVPKAPSELYCSDYCKDYGVTNAYYERVYGITIEEYLTLAEKQDFKCAICKKENFAMAEHHSGCLVVDHDHRTGQIRGLLCHNCNRAIGLLKDKEQFILSAYAYLKSVTTIPKGSTPKQVEAVTAGNLSQ